MSTSTRRFSVIEFYRRPAQYRELQGRTLDDILDGDNVAFEENDCYIPILFPEEEGCDGYPGTNAYRNITNTFKNDKALGASLIRAFERIIRFYGLEITRPPGGLMVLKPGKQWQPLLDRGRHHYNRIGRIAVSLGLLGHDYECQALCATVGAVEIIARQTEGNDSENSKKAGGCANRSTSNSSASNGSSKILVEASGVTERRGRKKSNIASALASWDTDTIASGLNVRPTFGPSIVPSPLLADTIYTPSSDLIEVIRQRYSERVASSWEVVYDERRDDDHVRSLTTKIGNQDDDGLVCLACYSESTLSSTKGDGGKRLRSFKFKEQPKNPIRLVSIPSIIRPAPILVGPHPDYDQLEDPKTWPSFGLHALKNLVEGTMDPFIINPSHKYFRVNGVNVEASMLAGPLPDFAIIEVGDAVAFLWMDRAACDYTPAIKPSLGRKRGHGETAGESGNDSKPSSPGKRRKPSKEPGSPNDPPRIVNDWKVEFDRGLRQHRITNETQARSSTYVETLRLQETQNLKDDQVIDAIAAFWISLMRNGTVFGYGTPLLFLDCRSRVDQATVGVTASGVGSESFVMPLWLGTDRADAFKKYEKHHARSNEHEHFLRSRTPEKTDGNSLTKSKSAAENTEAASKGKSSASQKEIGIEGHLLVATATKNMADSNKISISVWDSAPGHTSREIISEAYKGLVTHAGWLGLNNQGQPKLVSPQIDAAGYIETPKQQGGNTCGIYSILNAWAFMLNIPIHTSPDRRRRGEWRKYKEFIDHAREIIDLALCGCMDSKTVQAFMNVYGYSVNQDVKDPRPEVRPVQAVPIYTDTLNSEIYERHLVEWQQACAEEDIVNQRSRNNGAVVVEGVEEDDNEQIHEEDAEEVDGKDNNGVDDVTKNRKGASRRAR